MHSTPSSSVCSLWGWVRSASEGTVALLLLPCRAAALAAADWKDWRAWLASHMQSPKRVEKMDSFLLLAEPDCDDDLGRLAPFGLASTDVGDDMRIV